MCVCVYVCVCVYGMHVYMCYHYKYRQSKYALGSPNTSKNTDCMSSPYFTVAMGPLFQIGLC